MNRRFTITLPEEMDKKLTLISKANNRSKTKEVEAILTSSFEHEEALNRRFTAILLDGSLEKLISAGENVRGESNQVGLEH